MPSRLSPFLPFGIAATLTLLVVLSALRPARPGPDGFATTAFAELPVQVAGRIAPLDTVARVNLMLFSERQQVRFPRAETGAKTPPLPAIAWFMDLAMKPETAATYPIFKIPFPDELGLVGLAKPGRRHYSFQELSPYFDQISRAYQAADPEPARRSAVERQLVKLHENLFRYQQLAQSFHPSLRIDELEGFYAEYLAAIGPGMQAFNRQQAGQEFSQEDLNRFLGFMMTFQELSRSALLRLVPPEDAAEFRQGDWTNIGASLMESARHGRIDPYVLAYARLTDSYRRGDSAAFNDTLAGLRSVFGERYAADVGPVHFEHFFNDFAPFYQATILYVLAFLLVCLSWLVWPRTLNRAAFWLFLLTFALHTFGLFARMAIQGRPPVTNLYASAVFVGWGAVILCLILERIFRNGIGTSAGTLIGFSTLIIAHNLALISGDTLEMVRAVLDSNFWLATHVIVITIGYSAMFVAGALACFFLINAIFLSRFHRTDARGLSAMVYGITCFAALFSLVGTILGGIWADQSWGRFWGWDPKENGALLIVLISALYLHVRWGRLTSDRGLMQIAVFGNIVTSWSWFGTNMLGVGLHSYGFMDKAFLALLLFWGSQAAIILLAALPTRFWRSEYARSLLPRPSPTPSSSLPPSPQPAS